MPIQETSQTHISAQKMLAKSLVFGAIVATASGFSVGPALPLSSSRASSCTQM